jgi:PHD/YefM family antitoxin component YafN of YafNO toxin-antitoxin module
MAISRIAGDQPGATCTLQTCLETCLETCLATWTVVYCLPVPPMVHRILTETGVSISEHKKNPMATVAAGDGMAVAVLNRNEPAFYCVPARTYEELMDLVDDLELAFHPEPLREWQKLAKGIRDQFKNKLAERLLEPRIPASKLRGSTNRYKIKLRASGNVMLSITRPTSAEALTPWPFAGPLSWISCVGTTPD